MTTIKPAIYLAGPMSGIAEYNFPAFFAAADLLEAEGYEVFNPAQNDLDNWGDMDGVKQHATYRECLRQDLDWICRKADFIALLPGWENSKGARVEHALASAIGLEFRYLEH